MKLFTAQLKIIANCELRIANSKNKSSNSQHTKGFTLIELLVVIGILGILAAALVATIDPFEQLKKASDSKIKNIAVEFQTANVRYYTTHGAFPWNDMDAQNLNANCQGVSTGGTASFQTTLGSGAILTNCIGVANLTNSLIGEGELKTAFSSNTNDLDRITLNWDVSDETNMVVCFEPESKSQKSSPETNYNQDGSEELGAVCPAANSPAGNCYWCTR